MGTNRIQQNSVFIGVLGPKIVENVQKSPFLAIFSPISQLRAPLEGRKKFLVSSPFANLSVVSSIAYIEKIKQIARHAQTTLKKIYISSKKVIFGDTHEIWKTSSKTLTSFSSVVQIPLPLGKK